MKPWLKAFRLRTLPLAFSTIALGSFLAGAENLFRWSVFLLAILTTLFLQILSNLANDYGDTVHGADNAERLGPTRAVQSGEISLRAMKNAIILFSTLSLASGICLLVAGLKGLPLSYPLLFFALGIGAIAAAIKYTAGKNPYGYKGWGDFFVFVFFGLVGVSGTYFLHTHLLNFEILLPATAVGLLSTGVLNMNNMRDRVPDEKSGKFTVAVKLGANGAKYYHVSIIALAWLSASIFILLNYRSPLQFLFLASLPLFFIHLKKVWSNKEPQLLDKQLRFLVMSTLLFCMLLGTGMLISK